MAKVRPQPRTMLEHLIQQRDRTYEELAAEFATFDHRATISPRHLGRLARGERDMAGTTPATRRALQAMFDMPAEELLRPWAITHLTISPAADNTPLVVASTANERSVVTMAAQRARRFAMLTSEGTTPENHRPTP